MRVEVQAPHLVLFHAFDVASPSLRHNHGSPIHGVILHCEQRFIRII